MEGVSDAEALEPPSPPPFNLGTAVDPGARSQDGAPFPLGLGCVWLAARPHGAGVFLSEVGSGAGSCRTSKPIAEPGVSRRSFGK